MIAWVKGNDVLVNLILTRETGEGTENFLLDACDSWAVAVSNNYGNSFDCPYSKSGDNVIALDLPDTLPLGDYTVVFTAVLNGRDIRAVELCLFRVVSHNALANIPIGERFDGETSADIDIAIEVPTQSISEGKNSYQLWLEAGHTGSLEDFLSWLRIDYTDVEERLSAAEEDIESLQTTSTSHETRLGTAEGKITTLEGKMNTAESDIDGLQSDVSNHGTRLTSAETDIDNLQLQIGDISSILDTINGEVI